MKVKKANLTNIRYKDNNNFEVFDLYEVKDGIYTFYSRESQMLFMYYYGITCGCERRIENKKVKLYYNGEPITLEQREFLKKRAIALGDPRARSYDCGCKKKKEA